MVRERKIKECRPRNTRYDHQLAQNVDQCSPAHYLQDQASVHFLSGRLLFLPLQSSCPQSWHAFRQNERPPLPLHSWDPHLQQCRVRFCDGSKIETSEEVASPYVKGLLREFCSGVPLWEGDCCGVADDCAAGCCCWRT